MHIVPLGNIDGNARAVRACLARARGRGGSRKAKRSRAPAMPQAFTQRGECGR